MDQQKATMHSAYHNSSIISQLNFKFPIMVLLKDLQRAGF